MTPNFNRQFILLDFEHLDDPTFIDFVGRAEFRTYLILRRYVWRGGAHHLGLEKLYHREQKLACAISRDRIAEKLGLPHPSRVSAHLKALEDLKVIERFRTGRQTIFILGEWHNIAEEGKEPKPREWFYLDRVFGPEISDVYKNQTSDVPNSAHQMSTSEPRQTSTKSRHPLSNREDNTVNVKNGSLKELPNLGLDPDHVEYIVQEILDQLGDEHSRNFYMLVAAKVPEPVIRQTLSEIRVDGAKHPPRAFTSRMNRYAEENAQIAA